MNNTRFAHHLYKKSKSFYKNVPDLKAIIKFIDELIGLFCPFHEGKILSEENITEQLNILEEDFKAIIDTFLTDSQKLNEVIPKFFDTLPSIFVSLAKDAFMYYNSDPAAQSIEEIILCYPGFYAVMIYRISNLIYRLEIPVLARIMSEYAHSQTGIDIHPGATIGKNFYIDHGTGIVIGETTIIGNNVKIYQAVTLGTYFVDKNLHGIKRHPTIEDNVIIYTGTTILGGETVIGHDSIIGGKVWLTKSVPPYSKVYNKSQIIINTDSTNTHL